MVYYYFNNKATKKEQIEQLKFELNIAISNYKYYKSETKWIDNIMIKSNEHRLKLLKETIDKIKSIKNELVLLTV